MEAISAKARTARTQHMLRCSRSCREFAPALRPPAPGALPAARSDHALTPAPLPPYPLLKYEDGVLELRIGKKAAPQAKAEGRQIAIA